MTSRLRGYTWRAPAAGEGFLCGIAVTPSGTVYVSAPFDDRVHVLELSALD